MDVLEIKGKVNTAVCYARVVEDEAIEQIRRMCEALDYRVTYLKRVRVLNIELGDLKTGEYRDVTEEERAKLLSIIGNSSNTTVLNEED